MADLVPPYIATLRAYIPGKPTAELERELGITGTIKLASNENPYGPSPKAVAAMVEAASSAHFYPDGGGFYLKRAISERFNHPPEGIVLGNGSNELLELLIRTFMVDGTEAVASECAFIVYRLATQAVGVVLKEAPLGPGRVADLDAMAALVTRKTRLIFLANPNNPTGTYVGRDALNAFVATVDARCEGDLPIIVMDEAYFEFVDAADYPDGMDLLRRRPRTVVLRTFSKAYGLAGVRMGYGLTSPELVDLVNRVRAPFNVNSLALAAGEAALTDTEFLADVVTKNNAEKARLCAALTTRGIDWTPSQTNFVLVDFKRDASVVGNALLHLGIITRPMGGYGLPTCIRVSIGAAAENDAFLVALDTVIAGF